MKRTSSTKPSDTAISSDQIFADVIRAVLIDMNARNVAAVHVKIDLGQLFPQDKTSGHSLNVKFELCR